MQWKSHERLPHKLIASATNLLPCTALFRSPLEVHVTQSDVKRFYFYPGQETHEGLVRCAGSSTELLQLHCPGIQRDVPKIIHTLSAFQGSPIPPSLGDIRWL